MLTKPWFPISLNPKLLHSGSRAVWPCQAQRDVKKQFYCFCILVIVSISVCTQGNWWKNFIQIFIFTPSLLHNKSSSFLYGENYSITSTVLNTRKSSMLTSQLYFGYCPVWVELISGLLQVAHPLKIILIPWSLRQSSMVDMSEKDEGKLYHSWTENISKHWVSRVRSRGNNKK